MDLESALAHTKFEQNFDSHPSMIDNRNHILTKIPDLPIVYRRSRTIKCIMVFAGRRELGVFRQNECI